MRASLRRWGLAAFVVLTLTGAGLADRFAPAATPLPAPDRPTEAGGTWACPFLKSAGAPGRLHFANFGRHPARIRVTYLPDRRAPVVQAFDLGSGRAGTVGAPAAIRAHAAGAIVEYAGSDVVVSRTAFLSANGGTGAAAATCAQPGPQTVVASQGATLGVDTSLVLLNPATSDAVVDVSLVFDGQELEPESLRGRVVPGRGRLIVREGDFAFDEPAVAGVVRARTGRVVVDALLAAPNLIDLVPATGAATETVAIGNSSSGPLSFTSVAVGDVDAITDGRTLSPEGQGVFEQLAGGLPPNTPRVTPLPEDFGTRGPVALVASSSTAPVALGARWQVRGRGGVVEHATMSAVPPASRAMAVIGPPAVAAELRLLVANPAEQDATLSISVVTEAGLTRPVPLQRITLPAGSTAALDLSGVGGSGTVGVLLTSGGAPIAAAIQGIALQPSFGAFAVAAFPDLPRPPIAVEPDPRAGVPA
jgi:hypothetical protein